MNAYASALEDEEAFRTFLSDGRIDILTRILCGEEVDASFLPCGYVRRYENGIDAKMTKPSQTVA